MGRNWILNAPRIGGGGAWSVGEVASMNPSLSLCLLYCKTNSSSYWGLFLGLNKIKHGRPLAGGGGDQHT